MCYDRGIRVVCLFGNIGTKNTGNTNGLVV